MSTPSRRSRRGHPWRWLAGLLASGLLPTLAVFWIDRIPALEAQPPVTATPALLQTGAMLARAGNCMNCHTERGGPPYAGGKAITTPFGTVYSSNLTPDLATGLGAWTADDFWLALHHGIGPDGRRLNPAFPYTEFTRMSRADSDALFAWLRTLPPATKTHRPHQLKSFFGSEWALATWRSLFFRPGVWSASPQHSAEWNRGAYLVLGAAHCGACHGARNLLGGQWSGGFGGGLLPAQAWYAPSLQRTDEASVAEWPVDEIVSLLRDGVAPQGRVSGPMAEVVQHGTQHLPEADLRAMAVYLKSLPVLPSRRSAAKPEVDKARFQRGQALYADHCAACHGKAGEGGLTAQGLRAVPALAGNRLLVQEPAINLVRLVALGGFGVETEGHQRPFSMPGFAFTLSDEQIADVVTFMRGSWGASAPSISAYDVSRWRGDAD